MLATALPLLFEHVSLLVTLHPSSLSPTPSFHCNPLFSLQPPPRVPRLPCVSCSGRPSRGHYGTASPSSSRTVSERGSTSGSVRRRQPSQMQSHASPSPRSSNVRVFPSPRPLNACVLPSLNSSCVSVLNASVFPSPRSSKSNGSVEVTTVPSATLPAGGQFSFQSSSAHLH